MKNGIENTLIDWVFETQMLSETCEELGTEFYSSSYLLDKYAVIGRGFSKEGIQKVKVKGVDNDLITVIPFEGEIADPKEVKNLEKVIDVFTKNGKGILAEKASRGREILEFYKELKSSSFEDLNAKAVFQVLEGRVESLVIPLVNQDDQVKRLEQELYLKSINPLDYKSFIERIMVADYMADKSKGVSMTLPKAQKLGREYARGLMTYSCSLYFLTKDESTEPLALVRIQESSKPFDSEMIFLSHYTVNRGALKSFGLTDTLYVQPIVLTLLEERGKKQGVKKVALKGAMKTFGVYAPALGYIGVKITPHIKDHYWVKDL